MAGSIPHDTAAQSEEWVTLGIHIKIRKITVHGLQSYPAMNTSLKKILTSHSF